MASDTASFSSAPVIFFFCCLASAFLFVNITASAPPPTSGDRSSNIFLLSLLFQIAILTVCYLITGLFLTLIVQQVSSVSRLYGEHQDIFRPFQNFTSNYMLLHPLLLAIGTVTGKEILLGKAQEISFLSFTFAVLLAGAIPIYSLNFASVRLPGAVSLSWILHTAIQMLTSALVMDYVYGV